MTARNIPTHTIMTARNTATDSHNNDSKKHCYRLTQFVIVKWSTYSNKVPLMLLNIQ